MFTWPVLLYVLLGCVAWADIPDGDVSHMCRCSTRWELGESHCPACCSTFASVAAFDEHRTGGARSRRCLEPREAGLVAEVRDHAVVWTYLSSR